MVVMGRMVQNIINIKQTTVMMMMMTRTITSKTLHMTMTTSMTIVKLLKLRRLLPWITRVESEAEISKSREAAPAVHGAPAAQLPGGAADEDVVTRGVDHPVVSLAGVVVVAGDLQMLEHKILL